VDAEGVGTTPALDSAATENTDFSLLGDRFTPVHSPACDTSIDS